MKSCGTEKRRSGRHKRRTLILIASLIKLKEKVDLWKGIIHRDTENNYIHNSIAFTKNT